MKTKSLSFQLRRAGQALVIAAGLLSTSAAWSQENATSSWTGAVSGTWSNASNWSAGVPGAALTALFDQSFSNQPTLFAGGAARGIRVNGASQDVVIDGSGAVRNLALTISGTIGGLTNVGVLLDDPNNRGLTFGSNIQLQFNTNAPTFYLNNAGTLLFSNTSWVTNNRSITIGGTNAGGKAVFAGSSTINNTTLPVLIVNGAGTTTVSSSNEFSTGIASGLATTLTAGTLLVGHSNALGTSGSSGISFNGGTFGASVAGVNLANIVVIGASSVLGGTNSFTLSGNITNSGANRTLSNTLTTGTATLAGNVYLSETDASGRNLTIGSTTASGAAGSVTLISGNIANNSGANATASSLTANGGGTVILAGVNTYSGTTSVQNTNTVLQVGNGGTTGNLGGGAVTVTTGKLAFNRSNEYVVSNGISGTGSLEQKGTGSTILTGAVSHSGGTTITSGTLQVGNGGTTGSLSGAITNNSVYALNRSDAITQTGTMSGAGALLVKSGTVTISNANNTYSGGTTVSGSSTVLLGAASSVTASTINSGPLGIGAITLNDGSILATTAASGQAIAFTTLNLLGDVTIGQASGGIARVRLTGTVDLGGATRVVTLTNGSADWTAGNTTEQLHLNTSGSLAPVVQNGTLEVVGGVNTSNSAPANFRITNATYVNNAGVTIGNSARLTLGGGSSLGQSATPTLNATLTVKAGGVLEFADVPNAATSAVRSPFIHSLSGSGTLVNSGSNGTTATLTITGTSGSTEFAGAITDGTNGGKVALTKSSASTLTLSGNNTYSGATTVSGSGKLVVNGSLLNSAITVNSSATLAGSGTVGSVSISTGTVAPGNSAGTLTTGNFSLTSNSILAFDLQSGDTTVGGGVNDLLEVINLTLDGTLQIAEVGGPLTLGSTYRLFNYSGTFTNNTLNIDSAFLATYTGSQIITSTPGQVSLYVVPEPSTAVMLIGSAALMGLVRRRRR